MAHTGVIVALYPDRRHLGRLSQVAALLPNAQRAEDMHVTICYLGEREALEPYKVLILAALFDVAEHAPVPMPLELRIRGAGRFDHVNDDGTQAIYAAIQSPDLHILRDAIKASLASVGAEVDQTFPTFTPHITLGYIDNYLPTPAVRVPPLTIPAATLYLCWGNEKIAMPMRAAKRRAFALEAKSVAPMPSAALGHGPGGLFSNPALEGGNWRRREKAQQTFGGVKRADLPDSAFIDPRRRSFPVKTAQDVRDAVSSWGRYTGPLTFEEFKRRLIRRARAIGAASALPQAWQEGNDTATRGKSPISPLRGSQGQVAFKPFASRAQQAWAFATGQPFAERWADETDFGGLPARVARRKSKSARRRLMRLKASAEDSGSGGATGSGYGARAGQVIRGRLMRGADGKFTASGSAAPAGPARPPTRRKPKPKPKKARAGGGAKPKAPKLTPEQRRAQREAERAAEQAANLAAVGEAFMQADTPLSAGGLEALAKFAAGENLDAETARQLADLGVVTIGEDGTPRLSPDGRKVVNAAKRGDIRAAVDASFAAGEKVGIGAAGETLPGWEMGEDGKRVRKDPEGSADLSKEGEPKEPKKGGGSGGGSDDPEKEPTAGAGRSALRGAGPSQGPGAGGGGGSSGGKFAGRQGPAKPGAPKEGEPKETTEERQARRSAERQAELDARRERAKLDKARAIADAVERAGISPDAFLALRDWSEGGAPSPDQLEPMIQLAGLGLLNDRLEVSNEGRRALGALERGDVRQYFAAVQAGQRRLEREAERAAREARRSVEEAKAYKHGKHNQATHGRKGRAGRAGAAAYSAARAGGASLAEARAAGRQATAAERAAERAERAQKRASGLQDQAARARRAANSDQVTPAQRARLLEKADRLEARARGETVGPRAKPGAAAQPAAPPSTISRLESALANIERARQPAPSAALPAPAPMRRGAGDKVSDLPLFTDRSAQSGQHEVLFTDRGNRMELTRYFPEAGSSDVTVKPSSGERLAGLFKGRYNADADEVFITGGPAWDLIHGRTGDLQNIARRHDRDIQVRIYENYTPIGRSANRVDRDPRIIMTPRGTGNAAPDGWRPSSFYRERERAAADRKQRATAKRRYAAKQREIAAHEERLRNTSDARDKARIRDTLDKQRAEAQEMYRAMTIPGYTTKTLFTLGDLLIGLKHGKHDQRSHGRKGARGRAASAAYSAARAGGASHAEARAAANDVSRSVAIRQRYANISKQLEGHLSERQRASLQAEQRRLNGEQGRIMERMSAAQRTEAMSADVAPTVRGRSAPAKPAKADGDPTRAYGTDPNQSYQLQHRVVDMADLKASNLANGAINPNYDPALQPRDRSRAASQAQIDQVARNLNPDVLVTDFHRIDAGSPIIDRDGNVLSGNGRTLALQRAAEMNPAQYAAYKQRLKDEAERLGIDPKSIDGMKNPVLVRELKGDADPVAFAREANSSGTLRMSPLEQAKVDAGLVADRSLLKLNVRDGQDIDKALRDPSNKAFINDFLATVPDNERANLLTRNGELNQMGLYRAKAALYTKAFPGEAGSRLAESMLESLDPDVKTVQNGISASLPNISRATALMRNGDRDSALDLSEDFAKTIDVYARIKDNPALTANTPANQLVSKYLNQSQMFDRELTPDQERLLTHIDTISRRPSAVRDMFNNWARIVENQPPPGQSSLFGDAGGLTKSQLIDALIRGDTGGSSQAGMFDG
jgi:2'-5' RNA ligase